MASKKLPDAVAGRTWVMVCSQARSFSYSVGSKLVMPPPFTPLVLCSSHHSIILSYARAACSSWSKQPSDVGLPLRLCAHANLPQKMLPVPSQPAPAPVEHAGVHLFCRSMLLLPPLHAAPTHMWPAYPCKQPPLIPGQACTD